MNLQQFIESIAKGLGDLPDAGGPLSFQAWSVDELRTAVQEGRATVARVYRRKEHAAVLDVPVTAGPVHDLSEYGAQVNRVLGVIDGSGKVVQELHTTANSRRDWTALWPAETLAQPAWAPTNFNVTRVQGTDAVLLVDPPIPTADTYRLRVVMHGVAPAPWSLESCVDAYPYLSALRFFVQAQALASQVESATALSTSVKRMEQFVALMGAVRVADAEVQREAQ